MFLRQYIHVRLMKENNMNFDTSLSGISILMGIE